MYRDFRGVPAKLDGQGNYYFRYRRPLNLPRSSAEGNTATIGMDISINTSAETDEVGKELLSLMGIPFRKSSSEQNDAESTDLAEKTEEAPVEA